MREEGKPSVNEERIIAVPSAVFILALDQVIYCHTQDTRRWPLSFLLLWPSRISDTGGLFHSRDCDSSDKTWGSYLVASDLIGSWRIRGSMVHCILRGVSVNRWNADAELGRVK